MPLPKILIIGQPFNTDTGGGITLVNLFKGWDKQRLAVACDGHILLDNIDTSICNNYYQLGYKEFHTMLPFKLVQRKYPSGKIKFSNDRIQNLSIKKSKIRVHFIMNYMFPILKYLGVYNYLHKTDLSAKFCDWVKEFSPDILYIQAESRDRILFCIKLHEFIKKPMVFHMMDDWPSTISNRGLLKKYWKIKIDSELKLLLNRCLVFLSISDSMSQEYKKRYNKDFIVFHNPIDIQSWKKYQKDNYAIKNNPTILYAGRIGLGIDKSLKIIAEAIQQINEELNITMKFHMYTRDNPLWAQSYKCVEHKDFISHDMMPTILSGSDLIILPYDFSLESIRYIKYSMPTKATEYMISGTPIIIFAPEETAIVSYARKNSCAKLVTKNSVKDLSIAIKELIQDEGVRREIANNAKQTAEKLHDGLNVRKDFKKVICSLV